MTVSVIMATHNRLALLQRTLPLLLEQDLPAEQYEVVIVCDGCADGTADYLRSLQPRCRLVVLEQPQRGQLAGQSCALQHATGDVVLLLDDDLLCAPSLLRLHAAAHENAAPTVVVGPVSLDSSSRPGLALEFLKEARERYFARMSSQTGCVWPQDASVFPNCSVPRKALLEAGGFDESFGGGGISSDDNDLGLRLWSAGVQFRYEPSAHAREAYVKDTDALAREQAEWGRSEVLLCRRYPQLREQSILAAAARWKGWKRGARVAAICLPWSIDPVLAIPCWLAEQMLPRPWARRLGLRCLGLRGGLAYFRAAARVAGGWRALQQEVGAVQAPSQGSKSGEDVLQGPSPQAGRSPGRLHLALRRIVALRSAWYLAHVLWAMWRPNPWTRFDQLYSESSDPWQYDSARGRERLAVTRKILGSAHQRKGSVAAFEIGCGDGRVTELLGASCASVLAADTSAAALRRARQRCGNLKNTHFIQWDLLRDPPPGQFDLVLAMDVLDSLGSRRRIRAARDRIVGLTAPDGFLLVTFVIQHEVVEGAWWDRYLLRGGSHLHEFVSAHPALEVVVEQRTAHHVFALHHRRPSGPASALG